MEPSYQETPASGTNFQAGGMSVAERIWKYKLHYVIVIPALLLLFVLKIIPWLQGLYMSFVDYKPFIGLWSSQWVGLDHYKALFNEPFFIKAIANTIGFKLGFFALSGIIAFVAALALSGIRSTRIRSWVTTILLVPYVLPSVVIAFLIMLIFSTKSPLFEPETLWLAEGGSFRVILLLAEAIKSCGIPIFVALAAIVSKHSSVKPGYGSGFLRMNVLPAARAIVALTLIQLSVFLTTDLELLYNLINALVVEKAQTVDYFIFNNGFMLMQISLASAAWFIQFILQFALAVAAYYLVRGVFLRDLFSTSIQSVQKLSGGSSIAGGIAAVAGIGAVLFLLYFIFAYPFFNAGESAVRANDLLPLSQIIIFIFLYGVVVVISMLVTLTLAYPLTVRDLPGRNFYRIFLIGVMCMGSGLTIHDYMFYRDLGASNTVFPVLLIGMTNIVSVFVIKSIFNSRYGHLKEEAEREGRGELSAFFTLFVPRIWKPLIALGVLHFILLWNTFLPSFIYSANPSNYNPAMTLVSVMRGGPDMMTDPAVMQVGAIISLLPLVLFLAFKRWMTSEVLLTGLLKK